MRKNKDGFTMIELIIVVAILAIIIGVVSLAVLPYLEKSKKSVCIQDRDTLQNDFCYQMAGKLIQGSVDEAALLKEVMTSHGLNDDGGNQFSGVCRSGGVYTVTLDSTTMQIKDIVCSEHGGLNDALTTSSNPDDYLKAMSDAFADYILTAMDENNVAIKNRANYTWDSNGTKLTPALAIALKKKLSESGYKMTDTAMWKVEYKKNKGYTIYWYDTGKEITSEETGTGKKMTVSTDGTSTIEDCTCKIKYSKSERNEYYYIIK